MPLPLDAIADIARLALQLRELAPDTQAHRISADVATIITRTRRYVHYQIAACNRELRPSEAHMQAIHGARVNATLKPYGLHMTHEGGLCCYCTPINGRESLDVSHIIPCQR